MANYISGGNLLLDPIFILNKAGVAAEMKVADLGCGGAGHFVLPAAHMVGKKGIVYAVDILKEVLGAVESKAKLEGLSNIKYVWSDLEVVGGTKIMAESLDVALLINILFQAKEHKNILQEAKRLLKPGGKLLIVDWSEIASPFGPPAERRIKKEEIKKIVQSIGFKIIEEFAAGKYHFGLLFQKI